jgi:hypothetical protein
MPESLQDGCRRDTVGRCIGIFKRYFGTVLVGRGHEGPDSGARPPAARPSRPLGGVFGAAQHAARGDDPNAAPAGCGWGGGADWHTFLELGQAPRTCGCSGYGHVSAATVWAEGALRPSLVASGSAAHDRRHHPGRGDPQDAPPSEARGRLAAACPCPGSPSNVRLGCLSLRRCA